MSGFAAYWTQERIIETIRRHHATNGQPPRFNEWEKASPWTPAARTVTERFGSWNAAIEAAGFKTRPAHREQDWPVERIIAALQAWTAAHGGVTPRRSEWLIATLTTPSAATVGYRFGSWNAGIEAAGFVPRKQAPTTRWTKDLVAVALLDRLGATGAWPTYNGWRSSGGGKRPNSATIVALFGSFAAAKRYAGWNGDAAVGIVEAKCAECGTELANTVIGCRTCADRRRRRLVRAKSGVSLRVVESLLTPGDSDAGADGEIGPGRPVTQAAAAA